MNIDLMIMFHIKYHFSAQSKSDTLEVKSLKQNVHHPTYQWHLLLLHIKVV